MKTVFLLLAIILATQLAPGQLAGCPALDVEPAYAPLRLFTNGLGRIIPFQGGQLLQVGREYHMVAIPARGFVFENWMPVDVFTFTITTIDPSTGLAETTVTSDVSPTGNDTKPPLLRFTLQPVEVVAEIPGFLIITRTIGWQANFRARQRAGFQR